MKMHRDDENTRCPECKTKWEKKIYKIVLKPLVINLHYKYLNHINNLCQIMKKFNLLFASIFQLLYCLPPFLYLLEY